MGKTGTWRDDFPPVRHWTKHGTVELVLEENPGGWSISIKLDGKWLGFQETFSIAAERVANGAYDDKLGFRAKDAGLPEDFRDWHEPMSSLDGWEGV